MPRPQPGQVLPEVDEGGGVVTGSTSPLLALCSVVLGVSPHCPACLSEWDNIDNLIN